MCKSWQPSSVFATRSCIGANGAASSGTSVSAASAPTTTNGARSLASKHAHVKHSVLRMEREADADLRGVDVHQQRRQLVLDEEHRVVDARDQRSHARER